MTENNSAESPAIDDVPLDADDMAGDEVEPDFDQEEDSDE